METTIKIDQKNCVVTTSMENALQLIQKNSNCNTEVDGDKVSLTYDTDQLNVITSFLKTSKARK